MKKMLKQRLYKNPDNFLYEENFFAYVNSLGESGKLSTLPKNLYVYYVMITFVSEIENGGFCQYLTNDSRQTFYDLPFCAGELKNTELTLIVNDFCDLVSEYLQQKGQKIEDIDIDDDLDYKLTSLEDRFYKICSKTDLDKLALSYYRKNYTAEIIEYEAIKEKPSENCSYFIYERKKDIDAAVSAFLHYLESNASSWEITVFDNRILAETNETGVNLAGFVKLCPSDTKSHSMLDLGNIQISSQELSNAGSKIREDIYSVQITPSGFEDHEYKIKRFLMASGFFHRVKKEWTVVSIGDFKENGKGVRSREKVLNTLLSHIDEVSCVDSIHGSEFDSEGHIIPVTVYYKR